MKRKEFVLPPAAIRTLQPFFPGFDVARLRIREGIPPYVRYVVGEPLGYVEGQTIYLQKGAFQPDTVSGLALLAHEIAHCRQFTQCGAWSFCVRYARAYWRGRRHGLNHDDAYRNIPFEVEARAVEDLVFETLHTQLEIAPQLALVNSGSLKLYES